MISNFFPTIFFISPQSKFQLFYIIFLADSCMRKTLYVVILIDYEEGDGLIDKLSGACEIVLLNTVLNLRNLSVDIKV